MATPEIKSRLELETKITGDQKLNQLRESVKAQADSQLKLAAYKDFLKAFNPIKSPVSEAPNCFRITVGSLQYDVSESILEEHAKEILQMQDIDIQAVESADKLSLDVVRLATKAELNPLLETVKTNPDPEKQAGVFNNLQKVIDEQKAMKEQYEKFLVNNTPTDAQADVQKVLDLSKSLESAMISKNAAFDGVMAASSLAALKEQNDYLRKTIAGYESDPKFKAPKFQPNKSIAKDMQRLVDQFGTPAQKESFANILDPNPLDPNPAKKNATTDKDASAKNTVEKTVDKMSDAEKQAEMNDIVKNFMVNVDRTTTPASINVSAAQVQSFKRLYDLGYVNKAANDAQNGAMKTSRFDTKIANLQEESAQALAAGETKKVAKLQEKINTLSKKESQFARKSAGFAMQNTNIIERIQRDRAITGAANEMGKQSHENGYHGTTFAIDAFHPAFTNICGALLASTPRLGGYIDIGNGEKAVLQCPELEKQNLNAAVNAYGATFAPGETKAYCEANGVHTPNILETFFKDHTHMSPEQAQRNAALLSTGGLLAALYFGITAITGKDSKGERHIVKNLAIGLGAFFGANMASQGLTGEGIIDLGKDLFSGKLSLSDLFSGKINGKKVDIPELVAAQFTLKDVPYSVMGECAKNKSDPVQIDFAKLEAALQAKVDASSGTEEKKWEDQLSATKQLHTDPKGQEYLDKTLAGYGIKYADLTNTSNKEKTLPLNESESRKIALKKYELDKGMEANWSDDQVLAYVCTGKPTIDELAKAGKLKAKTNKPSVDGISEAQRNVDGELAKADLPNDVALALDNAMNVVNGGINFKTANDRPTFLYENGKLFIRSYGLLTPISITKDGTYQAGKLNIQLTGAQEAIKTANLVNFLIMTNTGQYDQDKPFAYSGNDITVGNKALSGWTWLDNNLSGVKKYFNTTVVDGNDLKFRPWSSSTLESIGGSKLSVGGETLSKYLNDMTNSAGLSIWKKGQGISSTSEIADYTKGIVALPKGVKKAASSDAGENLSKDDTKENDTAEAKQETSSHKKNTPKKKGSSGNASGGSSGVEKAAVAVALSTSLMNKYKATPELKDMPEDFYKAWAEASAAKHAWFVYNGKAYDRHPGGKEAASEVPVGDNTDVVRMREAAKLANIPFKNLDEALLAGDIVMTADNKEEATPKDNEHEFEQANTCNYAVKVKGGAAPAPVSAAGNPNNTEKKTEIATMIATLTKSNDIIKKDNKTIGAHLNAVNSNLYTNNWGKSYNIYTDPNASIIQNNEVITLVAHNQEIKIHPIEKFAGQTQQQYDITYGDKKLDIKFANIEDVLKIGHLTAFLVEKLKKTGGQSTPFKLERDGGLGMFGADDGNGIKFEEDGYSNIWNTEIFDADDKGEFAKELVDNDANVTVLKDRWNSLRSDWEA